LSRDPLGPRLHSTFIEEANARRAQIAPREARGDRQRPLRHVLGSDKCSLTSQFKGFQPALNEIEPDMLVAKGKIPRSSAWQW
jgi:hypothetical protein